MGELRLITKVKFNGMAASIDAEHDRERAEALVGTGRAVPPPGDRGPYPGAA